MKKILIFILFLGYVLKEQKAHDGWILKNDGDTLVCKIFSPNDLPRKLKKKHECYYYHYIYISTSGEEKKRINPGEIKEYHFEFGDSVKTNFDAITYKVSHNQGFIIKRKDAGFYNLFVRKLVTKGHYHLYYFEQKDWTDGTLEKDFILYNPTDSTSTFFSRTKQLMKILDWPPESERKNIRYKHWFKGKQNVIIDYNRFKAKTSIQN